MRALNLTGTAAALALALAVAGCPGTEAAPPASPQEAFERAAAAWESEDFGALLAVTTPPSEREGNVFVMVAFLPMMLMQAEDAEAAGAEYEAILEKHGVVIGDDTQINLEDEDAFREQAKEILAGTNVDALFGDLLRFMLKHDPEGDSPDALFAAELEDLEVDGDTATATAGERELKFIQVDGAWYMPLS